MSGQKASVSLSSVGILFQIAAADTSYIMVHIRLILHVRLLNLLSSDTFSGINDQNRFGGRGSFEPSDSIRHSLDFLTGLRRGKKVISRGREEARKGLRMGKKHMGGLKKGTVGMEREKDGKGGGTRGKARSLASRFSSSVRQCATPGLGM